MPNLVPSFNSDNTPDFFIVGKHAQPSERKAAGIIGISPTAVHRWTYANVQDPLELESIKTKGLSMPTFNHMTGYYATASKVSEKVRQTCIQLLIQSSLYGFQKLFDEMAGIAPEPEISSSSLATNDPVLSDLRDIFKDIRQDLKKSEERANKYFELSESHLKNMYNMYPSYFRMQDIQTGLSKFSTLEKLLKEVSEQLETTAIQRFYPLSHYLKEEGYTLRNGEKIAVSHLVSGWLKLSGKEMLKKSKEFHNATNQYPECSRPLILFAVEMVLSER